MRALKVVFLSDFSVLQYSQLLKIQKRLGKDEFPLIDQNYYQSFNEMVGRPIVGNQECLSHISSSYKQVSNKG